MHDGRKEFAVIVATVVSNTLRIAVIETSVIGSDRISTIITRPRAAWFAARRLQVGGFNDVTVETRAKIGTSDIGRQDADMTVAPFHTG